MSLYYGPRNLTEYLAELERRYVTSGYDHVKGEPRGWRAERQLASIRETGQECRRTTPGSKVQAWLMARVAATLRRT